MLGRTNTGGGSGGLNFQVVGNPQPSNPKKNTIWINTDQKISGWEFSATEPYPNLVKSSFVNSNKNVYAGVLYVDFDLQPNTTYTMFFDGQDGNNYYINENLFKNYTTVKVGPARTVVHLTTKDTDISGSYTDGMGWLILKNDKNQTNDHVFDNIYIVKGDSEIDPEGMVWIKTGISSPVEFNALKKNGIQVYPIFAYQYVSGTLVEKTAKSYQGGEWVDWFVPIFKNGKLDKISGFVSVRGTVNVDDVITFTTAGNVYSHWYSKERIDITNVKTIAVTFAEGSESYSDANAPCFGVSQNIPSQNSTSGAMSGLAAKKMLDDLGGTAAISGEFELDVSTLSGNMFLVFVGTGIKARSLSLKVESILCK